MEFNAIEESIARIIVMAKVDGNIEEAELDFIYGLAARCGLSKDDLQDIIENAESIAENSEANEENRVEYFYQVLIFALADGVLAAEEKAQLLKIGIGMGFPEDKLKIVLQRAEGISQDELSVDSLKKLWEE